MAARLPDYVVNDPATLSLPRAELGQLQAERLRSIVAYPRPLSVDADDGAAPG